MLTVDNAVTFLLEQGMIDVSVIIDSDLIIRSVARRNRNLKVEGPASTGLFVKQAESTAGSERETLSREAGFLYFCASEPGIDQLRRLVPRLISASVEGTVLVLELISGAASLWSQLETEADPELFIGAARRLGQVLATLHRILSISKWGENARLAWLSQSIPWGMTLHRPAIGLLADLGPANAETLRVVQDEPGFADGLESLCSRWEPTSVIHGDIRLDNVLVRPRIGAKDSEPNELWVTDWEMVQFGDPAWDLAGAFQDLLVFWVSTMPRSGDLSIEQMIYQAKAPLSLMRRGARAISHGYREGANLAACDEQELLGRAVAFSAARLVQSAFEAAHNATSLVGRSVCLLQISANLLGDPERAQTELYGIPVGSPLW